MISARFASCSAPETISAELAVLASTRTTSGMSVATPSGRDRMVGLVAVRVALDVDVALGQELAGDADRLVDVAARVAAQVEDEPVRAGRLDRLERVDGLVGGAVGERVDGQQRGARARDHRPRDRLHRDVGALEGVLAVLAVHAVSDGDGHLRPGLAADPVDDLADVVPGRLLAVDAHDDVAGAKAGLLGRAVLEHRDDQRTAVLGRVDLDADPDVRAGQAGGVGRALGRGHERGVAGVADGLGHALDRPQASAWSSSSARATYCLWSVSHASRMSANSLSCGAGLGVVARARAVPTPIPTANVATSAAVMTARLEPRSTPSAGRRCRRRQGGAGHDRGRSRWPGSMVGSVGVRSGSSGGNMTHARATGRPEREARPASGRLPAGCSMTRMHWTGISSR